MNVLKMMECANVLARRTIMSAIQLALTSREVLSVNVETATNVLEVDHALVSLICFTMFTLH